MSEISNISNRVMLDSFLSFSEFLFLNVVSIPVALLYPPFFSYVLPAQMFHIKSLKGGGSWALEDFWCLEFYLKKAA